MINPDENRRMNEAYDDNNQCSEDQDLLEIDFTTGEFVQIVLQKVDQHGEWKTITVWMQDNDTSKWTGCLQSTRCYRVSGNIGVSWGGTYDVHKLLFIIKPQYDVLFFLIGLYAGTKFGQCI